MKNAILLIMSAVLFAGTAMADIKIKTKQTTGGQSYENTTLIKGKRQRTEMMGGMMVTIMECDLNRDIQLNPQTKTYMVNLFDDGGTQQVAPSVTQTKTVENTKGGVMYVTTTIKDTGERKQMFGYTARHIIQTIETDSSADACNKSKTKMEMDMWVIDLEVGLACSDTRKYNYVPKAKNGGCQDRIESKTIGSANTGYPVYQKMTSFDANGGQSFTSISEVVELSRATLEQSLFEIPADYREVKDAAAMYATAVPSTSGMGVGGGSSTASMPGLSNSNGSTSGMAAGISSANATKPAADAPATVSAKKPGTVRVGITVKTTSVGEGITAADLSAAVQNSIGTYLKGTNVEIVPLEAKLAAAITNEAKEKECDFVLNASVAHKKGGGGGFGFGKMLASTVANTGLGHMGGAAGGVGGMVAGQVAQQAIVTAANLSTAVKNKDELTLDINIRSAADNSQALAKQFKAKAKSDGDDIISTVIEQAANEIVAALSK